MEYRQLGDSGLKVPVLSFGTATFGGGNKFFKTWGNTDVADAKRLVDICLEHGANFFDTADIYSDGLSEKILGEAIKGKRSRLLLATKGTFPFGQGPNDYGSSRFHLTETLNASLKRLNVDHLDVYYLHGFDGTTRVEETLKTLEEFVSSGKVRYIGASNFSGWHLMKSLGIAEKYGWSKYAAHQVHYSLIDREYEWELMPLGLDQKVGAIVWGPLSGGRLGGKFNRNNPKPANTRQVLGGGEGPEIPKDQFYDVIDVLQEVSLETGRSITQVALNWLLQRPSVSSVIMGARDEEQLIQNLGAVGWNLNREQIERLDKVSEREPVYPYWHQRNNTVLNPLPEF
jgi:aryl-alcohol dehydrogenase-like predicted oxidoreductase